MLRSVRFPVSGRRGDPDGSLMDPLPYSTLFDWFQLPVTCDDRLPRIDGRFRWMATVSLGFLRFSRFAVPCSANVEYELCWAEREEDVGAVTGRVIAYRVTVSTPCPRVRVSACPGCRNPASGTQHSGVDRTPAINFSNHFQFELC